MRTSGQQLLGGRFSTHRTKLNQNEYLFHKTFFLILLFKQTFWWETINESTKMHFIQIGKSRITLILRNHKWQIFESRNKLRSWTWEFWIKDSRSKMINFRQLPWICLWHWWGLWREEGHRFSIFKVPSLHIPSVRSTDCLNFHLSLQRPCQIQLMFH